jgi:hypothetical protein
LTDYNHSYPAPVIPGSSVIPYPNPAPSTDWDLADVQLSSHINDVDDSVEGAKMMAA